MHLNSVQIEKIWDFIKVCDIKYVDIQHELVDHIASEIELKMSNNQELIFEDLLNKIYSDYLPRIKKMAWSKEQAIKRYWRSKFWSSFRAYFTISNTTLTLLLFSMILLGTLLFGLQILSASLIIATIISITTIVKNYKKFGILSWKRSEYVVLNTIYDYTSNLLIATVSFSPAYILLIHDKYSIFQLTWVAALATMFIVFILIWNHAYHTVFSKMIKQELKALNPYLIPS